MTPEQKQTATEQLKQLRKELVEIADKVNTEDEEIEYYRKISFLIRRSHGSTILAQLIINADIK